MSEISSGLVAVAEVAFSLHLGLYAAFVGRRQIEVGDKLVRLSDAEAVIAQLREDLQESDANRERCAQMLAETAVALKGPEKALHRHGWQDLPEVAAKQSAALKLARSAIDAHLNPCGCSNGCEFCSGKVYLSEALAAIDSLLKGE